MTYSNKYGTLSSHVFFLFILMCADTVIADVEIWEKLKKGGKVIVMRHATVVKGPGSGDPLLRDASCKNERNLSKAGKHAARILGKKFNQEEIPVSEVRHSPFCRTTETAWALFKRGKPVKYLSLLEILGTEEASAQTAELSRIIGSYKGEGNLVLITHAPNINRIAFEPLKHLDFLVLQPGGGDEFDELGIIRFSGK